MREYSLVDCTGIWMHTLSEHNPEALARLRELARGRIVYEIGPGERGGVLKFLRRSGFEGYVGIQPVYANELNQKFGSDRIRFVPLDGLTVLKNVPGQSGIVVSSAVMNQQVMCSATYLDDLVGEIARVTPNGLSTIHFDMELSDFANSVFKKHGLKPKKVGPTIKSLKAEVYEYKKPA